MEDNFSFLLSQLFCRQLFPVLLSFHVHNVVLKFLDIFLSTLYDKVSWRLNSNTTQCPEDAKTKGHQPTESAVVNKTQKAEFT